MKELLEGYPVLMDIPVAWGEMDSFSHVNNIQYFRYFESVRILMFEKSGLLESMEKAGTGPILATAQCRFKLPVTYPDNLTAGVKVKDLQDDRFMLKYILVSHSHEKVAATGESLVVIYNYNKKEKTALPDHIRKNILGL
jgi:acyl-CoA thioester hydrolase